MLEIKHHPLIKNLTGMMTMLLFLMMQNTWKKRDKTTKKVVVEDEEDDASSHFSQLSSIMLQSKGKSPHISQLSSFNSYIQCSAGVVDETKTNKIQKNAKRSNQVKNTDITIQMFTPCIMVFSLFFNVTISSLIIQTRKN